MTVVIRIPIARAQTGYNIVNVWKLMFVDRLIALIYLSVIHLRSIGIHRYCGNLKYIEYSKYFES